MKKVKIGDIFAISWGYEQTNANFYRVKALRGKTQLLIQAVDLEVTRADNYTSMSADVTYNKSHYMLKDRDVFISDNAKGKIVKICDYYKDMPCFHLSGHLATPYNNEPMYESSYA